MAIGGVASTSATERFRQRFTSLHPSHFRRLQDLWASSIGLGTYLGDADDQTDAAYAEAIRTAVALGCNVLDTAINYRCQRSERTIGAALARLIADGAVTREELILCTKGGYLAFDGSVPKDPTRYVVDTVISPGLATYEEIVAGCHCLSPAYLDAALATSLCNLRVESIDVYYLHNPEQQLEDISRETFSQRLEAAFGLLEARAHEGKIRYYGTATWNGYRGNPKAREYLSLEALVELAVRVGGTEHHFRVVQLPYNLAMPEASAFRNQTLHGESLSLLDAARQLGLSVMVSASLLQGRLAHLGAGLAKLIPQAETDAQRALQFARSTPGVTTALAGMKQSAHVRSNLALAQQATLTTEQLQHLFQRRRTS